MIPGSDPNGDTLRCGFASPAEGGGGQTVPGPPFATNTAAINPTTGEFTWDTNGAGVAGDLYTAQAKIIDLAGDGNLKSSVAVDWIIRLVDVVGVPPQFDHPPTPACGSTIPAPTGQQLSFDVQASDGDAANTVTLTAAGVPAGATTTPVLPTSGNPVTATFNWTPTAAQAGTHVVTFQATDSDGQAVLCSVTINVDVTPPEPEPEPEPEPQPTPQPTPLPAPTQRGFHFSMRFDYVDKHGKAFVRATVFCHSPQCNLAGDGKLKILPFSTGDRSQRVSFNLGSAQSSVPVCPRAQRGREAPLRGAAGRRRRGAGGD